MKKSEIFLLLVISYTANMILLSWLSAISEGFAAALITVGTLAAVLFDSELALRRGRFGRDD
jgi:hypothetical protein